MVFIILFLLLFLSQFSQEPQLKFIFCDYVVKAADLALVNRDLSLNQWLLSIDSPSRPRANEVTNTISSATMNIQIAVFMVCSNDNRINAKFLKRKKREQSVKSESMFC